jgi:hypothetical protein
MKNLKWFVFVLVLAGLCFITCENPIMERWWQEREPEPEPAPPVRPPARPPAGPSGPQFIFIYDIIVETIIETETIYETIIVEMPVLVDAPPEVWRQYIDIIEIEFVIFAGNSGEFNGPPEDGAVTPLNSAEMSTNILIAEDMAQRLFEKHEEYKDGLMTLPFFMLLHGHANPVDFTQAETEALTILSNRRTKSVQDELEEIFEDDWLSSSINTTLEEFSGLISRKGYGGDRTFSESFDNSRAQLNRRVELILFTIRDAPLVDEYR